MAEKEELFFYKKNVPYTVGVRLHLRDVQGLALSENNPYVVVKEDNHRDFKRANKEAIASGLIKLTKEPDWDAPTPNALDDETANEIVKNAFATKKALAAYTSPVPVQKLLDAATAQKRPAKTMEMIQERLVELGGGEEEVIDPKEMQGVN